MVSKMHMYNVMYVKIMLYKGVYIQWNLLITDTLEWIILSIIERLSSFRGKNVLPLVIIQRCPLFGGSIT